MRKIIAICCSALWLVGCASATPESSRPETAAQADLADASDAGGSAAVAEAGAPVTIPNVKQVRCRVERIAGSNIPKRICLTDAEWDEVRNVSQQAYESISRPMNAPDDR